MTYQYFLIITDYADTPDERIDQRKFIGVSPVFPRLGDAMAYAAGRGHQPQACTCEDIEGIKFRRLVEYDIVDSEGTRLYINFA